MISSFTTRFQSLVWFLIFTFTLSCMPHLELIFPYKLYISVQEAQASETAAEEPSGDETPPPSEEASALASATEELSPASGIPSTSFKVDDYTGAAHVGYPIITPPGRNGLAPKLSIDYSSSGGNGWMGVGFDLSVGFIQRRGPRKAVPKYDSTDIFELNLGGAPQELVPIGGGEYRLRIEGAYLKIKHYSTDPDNYWEIVDKSGLKMRFGYSLASRIGKVRDPSVSTDTHRWFLDRVIDPRTNYMEFFYLRDQAETEHLPPPQETRTIQVYLQEIRYNGQDPVTLRLPHNHKVIFTLEDRPDPIYNYRGGFRMKTRKRLSMIEIKTNDVPVRKYVLQYRDPFSIESAYSARSLLWKITHYGYDNGTLPSTVFSYQGIDNGADETKRGFADGTPWTKDTADDEIPYNYIHNNVLDDYQNPTHIYGTYTDVIDMDGDALPDRLIHKRGSGSNPWEVHKNTSRTVAGFDPNPTYWPNPSGQNKLRSGIDGGMIGADLIDFDGDGLPDRVISADDANPSAYWTVYFNNRAGFDNGSDWDNPSAYESEASPYGYYGYKIREGGQQIYSDVIDLNGDGLGDRVVYKGDDLNTWWVYFNNGVNGFSSVALNWQNPSYDETEASAVYMRATGPYGVKYDLIDMNNDGLPDRVCFMKDYSAPPNSYWRVYFNTGSGFDPEYVLWANPSATSQHEANEIRKSKWDVIDFNGDNLPDRVVYDKDYNYDPQNPQPAIWKVYLNTGKGFHDSPVIWRNPSPWGTDGGNVIRETGPYGTKADVLDIDGDGLPDRVVYDKDGPDYDTWQVYFNKGPVTDLLSRVENGIGGTTDITYLPSTKYSNTFLPFVVQTVSSVTQRDGRNNPYTFEYQYEGGSYDPQEVEFRGFRIVTSCQPACQGYVSMTETEFHQDYYGKGKVLKQTVTSSEGHTRQVDNIWVLHDNGNGTQFPLLDETKSTITDVGIPSFNHATKYTYDDYFNVSTEKKGTYSGTTFNVDIETDFEYKICTDQRILSKPTKITVKDGSGVIASRKWMDYNCTTGNLLSEEVCKSDTPSSGCNSLNYQNPVIIYDYCTGTNPCNCTDGTSNLCRITDPMGYITTLNYDSPYDSSKTHVYETTNYLNHKTTTEYDPRTGNLTKLIPPHLQGIGYVSYSYDPFGRKKKETRPDGGYTSYTYNLVPLYTWQKSYNYALGDYSRPTVPNGYIYEVTSDTGSSGSSEPTWPAVVGSTVTDGGLVWTCRAFDIQYTKKTEHIIGGPSVLDHYTYGHFDGMGRTYWVSSTGPGSDTINTATTFDFFGRVQTKTNPFFCHSDQTCDQQYYTTFTYDGLSRVVHAQIPDRDYSQNPPVGVQVYRDIYTTYKGLDKVVQNQRGKSTTYTYDVYQRLKKVAEPTTPTTTFTEYVYDTLGNLTDVYAAKDGQGGNLMEAEIRTHMTYDSLSKKRSMTDPDMGYWEYEYDKSGNLIKQWDANRPKPQTPIQFDYDGLNRLRYKYYPDGSTVTYTYDETSVTNCAEQIVSVPYSTGKLTRVNYAPPGQDASEDAILSFDLMQRVTSSQKKIGTEAANCVTFNKSYDSAGRVISITYPGPKTYSYEYDVAGNLLYLKDNGTGNHLTDYSSFTALGQPGTASFPKTGGGSVTTTYTYVPETGRLRTLVTDGLTITGSAPSDITHNYTYDNLNRLETAVGTGTNPYNHTYTYDRIGNIKTKPDVGTYSYDYGNRPHAVNSAGGITLGYDDNGNMTSRNGGGRNLGISYNYDNKPTLITNYGSNSLLFTYDGNGQRVKKYNYSTGYTVLYFGGGYEKRGDVGIIHLFAGNQRVVSVGTDGYTQIYHPDHLGSSWIVTDIYGAIKEKNEFYPFGGSIVSESFDSSPNFPPVNYTFTGQEEDDEVGLYNYGARLYDPVLGRFISPDRLVPDPGDPQALNRYSYCLNNPLIYIDPSGELIFGIDTFVFFTLLATAMTFGGMQGYMNAQLGGGSVWKGAFTGAIIGGAGFVASMGVVDFLFPGAFQAAQWAQFSAPTRIAAAATGGFTAGTVSGGLNAAFNGGNVWQQALYGGLIGATIAGTMQAAVELFPAANNTTYQTFRSPKTGQLFASRFDVMSDAGIGVEPLTAGEKIYDAALAYKGKYGIPCNELILRSIKDLNWPIDYFNTSTILKSRYFFEITDITQISTGEVVVWPGRHMGLYDKTATGSINMFHSPNTTNPVGYESIGRMSEIFNMAPRYFRYINPYW